ncbi:MAG: ABC transporter substrate-binding protein [Anaerolineae bacterium]|nr:ABC transporter substrate-binding protein [Anaerolineae bacterium]
MNTRRLMVLGGAVVIVVALVVVVWLAIRSDDDDTSYTVGIVNIASILNPVIDGFKEGMVEKGYIEGETITYVYDGAVSRDDLESTIQSLIDQDVDVIVSLTTPATLTAKELTAENQMPVVFVPVTDPLGAGIVTDISHPGGNITGIISGLGEEIRLEWLTDLAPDAERIFFPYNPDDTSPTQALEALRPVAETLGVELVTLETPDADAVTAAIENIPDDVDAIFIGPDSLVGRQFEAWIAKAIELKLPLSGSSLAHVEAGMLCSYSYSPFEAGKHASRLVDQILRGTAAGDLPVETADPVFSINLLTAEQLELDIAADVLGRAHVIVRE